MTIELLFRYIHYDVDQLTWRYGKTHTTDEENKEISQTTAHDESDSNLILRLAITGTARLRRILHEFITAKTEDANDTLPVEKKSWGFTFNTDVTADGHALAELMHWFVVRFCLWQWCKMFAPEQATMEKQELDDLKKDLDKMLKGGDSAMPSKEPLVRPDDEYSESVTITYQSQQ